MVQAVPILLCRRLEDAYLYHCAGAVPGAPGVGEGLQAQVRFVLLARASVAVEAQGSSARLLCTLHLCSCALSGLLLHWGSPEHGHLAANASCT